MYELFEHTADLGLRVRARDVNGLFVDAARGLLAMMVEDLDTVRPVESCQVTLAEADIEYLFLDWLQELVFLFDARRLLLGHFEVDIRGPNLTAVVGGEMVDPSRHRLLHEVKAVTYHGLSVRQEDHGWLAEVIVDI